MVSVHRTRERIWRPSSAATGSPGGYGRAVTLEITGSRGGASGVSASTAANRRAAGAISREWKAALTGSGTQRIAGSPAVSSAVTADTPAAVPEITTWVAELSLATSTSVRPDAARVRSTSVRPAPRTAAIAPPSASPMSLPRSATSRRPPAKSRTPATISALNSPRL
ncbi:hypothetical protein GCM10020254_76100 [Streptomyces goshikiensis]